jgi:hypothetical protein
MNKINIYGFFVMLVAIAFIAFTQPVTLATTPPAEEDELQFPGDVLSVFENACFDCHISESKNVKGKTKLNFSKWNDYKDSKKVGKLDEICEVVKENEMPPEKYLEKHPDKKLTQEQIALVCAWVDEEAEKLMGSE